ncbi:MAG TPA: hypothetical protein VJ901_02550 [Thermoanaerobaculia bacterium]|nr:hypothetical protein [Thermoanaerobaculia bacterium]
MNVLKALAIAALPAIALAQAPPSVRVIVPVVGSVIGAGEVRWRTALELVNDSRADVTVAITLMTVPDQPAWLTTISAGETVAFTDVVGEAFGGDAVLSPLVVDTLGRRSVTVRAAAYGTKEDKVFRPEPITIAYGATWTPIRVLQGLSFSDAFRTNVGLVNLSARETTFHIAVQRLPGRNLAVAHVPMPAYGMWHVPIQTLFPMITKGDDFTLVIETADPQTYVYASVVENETNSATFVQPQVGTSAVVQ